MRIKQALNWWVIGAGVLGMTPLFADEVGPADPVQMRQQAQSMNQQERIAQHEEMQNRVRNMSQEEKQLMRETSYNGRAAMTRERSRDGSGSGNQYGRGFESRRGGGASGGMGGGRGGRGR